MFEQKQCTAFLKKTDFTPDKRYGYHTSHTQLLISEINGFVTKRLAPGNENRRHESVINIISVAQRKPTPSSARALYQRDTNGR